MVTDQLDSRVTLSKFHENGRLMAERLWVAKEDLSHCSAIWTKGKFAGKRCPSKSGRGIWPYEGLGGPCMAHGGAKKAGRAVGAWLMAHKFAEELDVSPWEALLMVIRITAGRLRYIEGVLATATSDDELEGRPTGQEVMGGPNDGGVEPGRDLSWWVEKSEVERTNLAKFSKAAIDAGVAQLLIEKELRQGDEIGNTLVRVLEQLEAAGVGDDVLEIARGIMTRELEGQLALGS